MDGSSRGAWHAALTKSHEIERGGQVDLRHLAGELFAVSEMVGAEAKLRRALSDPSRDAWPKRDLASRLFESRLSGPALQIVHEAVSGRWAHDQDLVDALERLGIDLVFAAAEAEGWLNRLEDELFSVDQAVRHHQEIRETLGRRDVLPDAKVAFIRRLFEGKISADALWLATRPIMNPRGRKYTAAVWRQLAIAARRRHQITAVITSAIQLTAVQKHRIESALTQMYGRGVNANLVIDPQVLGGIHIRVGDDVIDGSILRRLDNVRRAMSSR
ncbi:ATP synthase subunit delta [Austwickia sp. TVS 96-490-7B]|uniref:F0F1 ATP synthase subunit delta n=1 Tax=Austwickia sp. TVS 96-490-7B TaxID=2830843 RepID=UPI001C577653|nr:F0F1 ATP synthase subunit delta [Austwickia sp. TVS 96-490-7B]MBW3084589.1 ATP synthase subunit delta [Austwickia sp. TVS 96-490-7B]